MTLVKSGLFLMVALIMLISCSNQSKEAEVVIHPQEENMPFHDVTVEKLEVMDADNLLEILPENLKLFYRLLNGDSSEQDTIELDLFTSSNLNLVSLNDTTLLILDKSQDQLVHYSLKDDKSKIIANQGRGPGDLFFAEELSIDNGKAYVGMQGFQISVFNCQTGACEHERVIKTDYNNYSISPAGDVIFYLGIAPFVQEQDFESKNIEQFVIHKADSDGDLDSSFFPIYDHKSPNVADWIMSTGNVRSFKELNKAIINISSLPYLYIHDLNGELITKYEIPNFIRPKGYKSIRTSDGGYRTRQSYDGDYSIFSLTSKVNDNWLLIQVNEYRDVELTLTEIISGNTWNKYYAFDVRNSNLIELGSSDVIPYGTANFQYLIENGVVENKQGRLLMTKTR